MKEFRVCPACNYGRGFHAYFKEHDEGVKIGLICPSCGQSYDLPWQEKDLSSLSPEKGPVFPSKE